MERRIIRLATAAEAARVASLFAKSPGAAQWTSEDIVALQLSGARVWICEDDGILCGAVVSRFAGGEAEILNLAVEPAARRKKIGTELIGAALKEGELQGAQRVFLEVRASNEAAREFYFGLGFQHQGRRRGYYNHPAEDALVLSRKLK